MKKATKPNKELVEVRGEISRINQAYASGFKNFDSRFQDYILKKLKDLKAKELELMKGLGYV